MVLALGATAASLAASSNGRLMTRLTVGTSDSSATSAMMVVGYTARFEGLFRIARLYESIRPRPTMAPTHAPEAPPVQVCTGYLVSSGRRG